MNHSRKQPRHFRRKIHVVRDGETVEWSYQVTAGELLIRSPDFTTHRVSYFALFDDGRGGRSSEQHVTITPSLVKVYVESVLIAGKSWNKSLLRVGSMYIDGVITNRRCSKLDADRRVQFQRPIRDALTSLGGWVSIPEIRAHLLTTDAFPTTAIESEYQRDMRVRRETVDRLASMIVNGIVESNGELHEPDVRFRLRDAAPEVVRMDVNAPKFKRHRIAGVATMCRMVQDAPGDAYSLHATIRHRLESLVRTIGLDPRRGPEV